MVLTGAQTGITGAPIDLTGDGAPLEGWRPLCQFVRTTLLSVVMPLCTIPIFVFLMV